MGRAAGSLSKYVAAPRDYVRSSFGEFSVAKGQYALLRSGWFSDRTACYLAAGRPAIVQGAGFDRVLRTGAGRFAFSTVEDAVAAFEDVCSNYCRHARAARELAEECLRAETGLGRLLGELGA